VIADPSRTADFASILRPPGAVNRKNGEEKVVKVLASCEPCEPSDLAAKLSVYVKANQVKMIKDAPIRERSKNSDLMMEFPQVDTSLDVIVTKCAQVAAMRAEKGDIGYEHWRGVAGLAKYCTDGEALMHSWSEDYPGYTYEETQAKIDTWTMAPTVCDFFEKCNPDGCMGCEFKGKIKTPSCE